MGWLMCCQGVICLPLWDSSVRQHSDYHLSWLNCCKPLVGPLLSEFDSVQNYAGQVYHIVLSREAYCSFKVSRVCVASVLIEIHVWVLKMDGTIVLSMIDRLSDANMSFKHYSPSLCSPVAAVADKKWQVETPFTWMAVTL